MTQRTLDQISYLVKYPAETIRISGRDFKEMLLDNHTVVVGGNVRYFQGVSLGEDVYAVKLLPIGWSSEFGTIKLNPKTEWITTGNGLILDKNDCNCKDS